MPEEYPLLTRDNRSLTGRVVSTAGNIARDYWDLGAVVLGGLALGDYRGELFGELREGIAGLGLLAGMVGPGIDSMISGRNEYMRLARNLFAGIAAFEIMHGSSYGLENRFTVGSATFSGVLSYIYNSYQRQQNNLTN